MKKLLFFLNALSAQLHPATYVKEQVQELIAQRLDLPLATVQNLWLDIDMTQVRQRYSREKSTQLSAAETLRRLFNQATWMQHTPPQQWQAVIIVPAIGHVDKLYVLHREATRMTDGRNAVVTLLYQEHEGKPQLFHVIPEPHDDAVFLDALLQTRGEQGR
jgi:hypothetical protein